MKKRLILISMGSFLLGTLGIANATIISGDYYTGGGNLVNLSGLEWMSFDHVGTDGTDYGTLGLSYDTVAASDSLWMTAGWRFATGLEVNALYYSLGLVYDGSNAEDGTNFLFDNWGSLVVPETVTYLGSTKETKSSYEVAFGYYGDRYIRFAGTSYEQAYASVIGGRSSYTVHLETLLDTYGNYEIVDNSYEAWSSNSLRAFADSDSESIGSFLVREAPDPVPEPATMLLLGTGLVGLAGSRIRRKKSE